MASSNDDTGTTGGDRAVSMEILAIFARLGTMSFGGPIAHLGYFHEEFVNRRRWISDAGFADLVALGQILPGPASSQVGFSSRACCVAAWPADSQPGSASPCPRPSS